MTPAERWHAFVALLLAVLAASLMVLVGTAIQRAGAGYHDDAAVLLGAAIVQFALVLYIAQEAYLLQRMPPRRPSETPKP